MPKFGPMGFEEMFASTSGEKLPQSSIGQPEGKKPSFPGWRIREYKVPNSLSCLCWPGDEASTQMGHCHEQNSTELVA